MSRRHFTAAAGAMALGGSRIGTVAAQAGYPADYHALIEGSKNEQGLVMYTTFSPELWAPTKALFQAKYPWIDLQTLDLGGREAVERYYMEKGASARTADIMVLNAPEDWYELARRGEIIDYRSPEIDALPEWSLPYPGVYTATVDGEVFGWNRFLLPDDQAPRGLGELVEKAKADPETFRGRITTYPVDRQSFYYLTFRNLLQHHGEKLWGWLEVLAPLTRLESSSGTMMEKVMTGEYVLAYFMNQNPAVLASQNPERSKVFAWSFVTDGTPISPRQAGIPVATGSPNAARLLLDTIVSREGQLAIAKGGRSPYRADVTQEDVGKGAYTYNSIVEAVGSENALFVTYEPELMKEKDEIVARWKAIFKI